MDIEEMSMIDLIREHSFLYRDLLEGLGDNGDNLHLLIEMELELKKREEQ